MEIFRKIGSWLFLLGVLIALIAGIIVGARWYTDTEAYIAMILGVLGFIVGILSFFAVGQITHERIPTFLIGALILSRFKCKSKGLRSLRLKGFLMAFRTVFEQLSTPRFKSTHPDSFIFCKYE